MKVKYEIRVVDNDVFDELPYKDARNALGLADAKNGVAYVRRTGVKGIDYNTMHHEFDELLAKISPHEEDGIRYKKGGIMSFFKPIISLLSIIPSPLQPFAIAANVGLTGKDIAQNGFSPLHALSLAGPTLDAFQGFSGAAQGASLGSKLGGAFKGALNIPSAAEPFSSIGGGASIGGSGAAGGFPSDIVGAGFGGGAGVNAIPSALSSGPTGLFNGLSTGGSGI